MESKIKVLIKRPDEQYGHMTWISSTLANMQRTVDGYIQAVTLSDDIMPQDEKFPDKVILVCNEEGKVQGLPKNMDVRIEGLLGCGWDSIAGTFFLCGEDGDEFCDVPITMKQWKAYADAVN